MAFQGRDGGIADRRLAQLAGGVTAATLARQGASSVSYAYVRMRPMREATGLGGPEVPVKTAMLTAWREGEADEPRPDDSWVVAGVSYLIVGVTKRFDAEESSGYCVYDCDVTRPSSS
jgi:hypothetical protein